MILALLEESDLILPDDIIEEIIDKVCLQNGSCKGFIQRLCGEAC